MNIPKQIYLGVRRRVFVNRWGVARPTIDWLTNCPDCGVEFEVFTDDKFTKPVRRCVRCKHSGARTNMEAVPIWPEGGGEGDGAAAGPHEPEAPSAKPPTSDSVRNPDTSHDP